MIRFCWCTNALSPDMQLFKMGLFPVSFTSPKTAFTFAVLDNFLLDNLKFPDRYRELMRVGRQWRQLKQSKWHGFACSFCPACLQPGVNVNLAEKNAADPAWLYLRSLVMDGNFKAEHMFPVNPTDEVALTNGLGFMVSDAWYKMHLAKAKDVANASHHKLEATGIGGCFVPHLMVNFQKGERFTGQYFCQRQMNMDYALC
ncbi:hypothetical protein BDR05DRAFT_978803 [Suillus weaverae]|nr:hypothetical protein BDR05DRAFT_978803 [Suillus weaverae]